MVDPGYLDSARKRVDILVAGWIRTGDLSPLVAQLRHTNIIYALSGAIALGETRSPAAASPLQEILRMGDDLVSHFASDPTQIALIEGLGFGMPDTLKAAALAGKAREHASWLCEEVERSLKHLSEPASPQLIKQQKRKSQGNCVMCGRQLGFFDKLLRGTRHSGCTRFSD